MRINPHFLSQTSSRHVDIAQVTGVEYWHRRAHSPSVHPNVFLGTFPPLRRELPPPPNLRAFLPSFLHRRQPCIHRCSCFVAARSHGAPHHLHGRDGRGLIRFLARCRIFVDNYDYNYDGNLQSSKLVCHGCCRRLESTGGATQLSRRTAATARRFYTCGITAGG